MQMRNILFNLDQDIFLDQENSILRVTVFKSDGP